MDIVTILSLNILWRVDSVSIVTTLWAGRKENVEFVVGKGRWFSFLHCY